MSSVPGSPSPTGDTTNEAGDVIERYLRELFFNPGCGTTALRLRSDPARLASGILMQLMFAGYMIVPVERRSSDG